MIQQVVEKILPFSVDNRLENQSGDQLLEDVLEVHKHVALQHMIMTKEQASFLENYEREDELYRIGCDGLCQSLRKIVDEVGTSLDQEQIKAQWRIAVGAKNHRAEILVGLAFEMISKLLGQLKTEGTWTDDWLDEQGLWIEAAREHIVIVLRVLCSYRRCGPRS